MKQDTEVWHFTWIGFFFIGSAVGATFLQSNNFNFANCISYFNHTLLLSKLYDIPLLEF